MLDFFNNIFGNEYFGIALIALLIFLVVLFFIILIFGKDDKDKKILAESKDGFADDSVPEKIEINNDNTTSFDISEFTKEATGEFELKEIEDVKPVDNDFLPEVKEESPAINIVSETSKTLDDEGSPNGVLMEDFNFDDLSKSIADELEKLKNEQSTIEVKPAEKEVIDTPNEPAAIPSVKFVDSFEEVNVTPIKELAKEKIELPKVDLRNNDEPVIKEDNVPLYARLNQDNYDINK